MTRDRLSAIIRFFALPVRDYVAALVVCLQPPGGARVAAVLLAAVSSWWVYVPLHELAHAYGCILAGGEVTRLEIDAIYGAAWLRRVFPFVTVGSAYAGQLSGFDTRGSDLTYLATDLLPFVFTVLLGVPLLRSSAAPGGTPLRACVKLGMALPIAYAPFISLTGDYYEIGSILVSRMAHSALPHLAVERWRSDDLVKLAAELFSAGGGGTVGDAVGLACATLLGVGLAFATYGLGALWSGLLRGGVRIGFARRGPKGL